jgi:hypothetical protein
MAVKKLRRDKAPRQAGFNPPASCCSLITSGFWRFESFEYQRIALASRQLQVTSS